MKPIKDNGLSKNQKRDYAELLYKTGEYTIDKIAEMVGVNEKTIRRWKTDYNWEELRKSLLVTKAQILRNAYDVLDAISAKIKDADGIGDTKLADMFSKYSAAVKNLETETSIADITEVGRLVINYIQTIDIKFAAQLAEFIDTMIKERLKRF